MCNVSPMLSVVGDAISERHGDFLPLIGKSDHDGGRPHSLATHAAGMSLPDYLPELMSHRRHLSIGPAVHTCQTPSAACTARLVQQSSFWVSMLPCEVPSLFVHIIFIYF